MTVKIKIPSSRGHDTLSLSVPQAQEKLGEFAQKQWIVGINGKLADNQTKVKDGDEIVVAPKIRGG